MDGGNLKEKLLPQGAAGSFKVSADELTKLFDLDGIREKKSNKIVEEKYGGVHNLIKTLKSSEETGITEASVPLRHSQFGNNKPLIKEATTFWEFVWECFEDLTLRILIVASFISEAIGIYQTIETGDPEYVEGLGIFSAILIVVLVTSINNYSKELQFRKLSEESQERNITVIRDGKEKTISVFDLVVGDIAKIGAGDVMPVDAIILWSMKLSADESTVTGEPDQQKKDAHHSPFLLSGSQIADGAGRALILTVGAKTFLGKNLESIQQVEEDETPLQKKLNYIAELIGKIGLSVALATFVICMVQKLIIASEHWEFEETFNAVLDPFIIAVTIVVVAVPEGLPLAVTLSLAFSVNQMKKQNNLVRHLDASETMGQATNICSDKTGTLTQNVMTVKAMCIGRADGMLETTDKSRICDEVVRYLGLHFCHNTNASYQPSAGGELFTGSRTEIALLKLGKLWGWEYEKVRHQNKIKIQIPFNSELKKMTTVVEEGDEVFVFIKGASEIIVNMCHKHINLTGHTHTLDENEKQEIYEKVINSYAHRAYRTLGLAYKIVKKRDWDKFINEDGSYKTDKLENKMILLGVFGIQDPVRNGVPEAVRKCQHAGITVRMVTGDNKETAMAIAKECGILQTSYKHEEGDDVVLTGKEFRTRVGEDLVPNKTNPKDKVVQHLDEFSKIIKKLRVLSRSSPQDKLILVTGLRQLNEVVAVTGDGSNDAPALKKSNVGFSMHIAGTQLAQEASDIILLDDNFASIVVAVLWGRNIYDCISKFIQFQLTVNIVALTMCFVGSIIGGDSPITPIQMLWVNLIMDTFAALALATEPPNDSLLDRQPVKHDDSLLTPDMMKTIIGQSIYQLSWLFFILYGMSHFSDGLFQNVYMNCDAPQEDNEPAADTNSTQTDNAVALESEKIPGCNEHTLFFHTFVMMQVFNEINCRKLKSSELNVFKGFFNNSMFLMIMVVTIVVQVLIVQFGGLIFQTTALTLHQHIFALAVGVGALIWGILFRLVPLQLFACFKFHEEEKKESTFTNMVRKKTTRRAPVKHS